MNCSVFKYEEKVKLVTLSFIINNISLECYFILWLSLILLQHFVGCIKLLI